MDRNVDTGLCLIVVEQLGHLLNRLKVARVRRSKNDDNTDRVLIDHPDSLLGIQAVVRLGGNRHQTFLNIKVAREFLDGDLSVAAKDDVGTGLFEGFAGFLALRLPALLHSETTEHDRLA